MTLFTRQSIGAPRSRSIRYAISALVVLCACGLLARAAWAQEVPTAIARTASAEVDVSQPVAGPSAPPAEPQAAAASGQAQQPGQAVQQSALEPQQPAEQTPIPPVNYEVVVTAPRMEIPLKDVPAATSVVPQITLRSMSRGIGAEEALKIVPGMKIDNQADGERVHLSIRGQGLLTERGIRGVKVLVDGLPLNDPTGFVPDLFDIDWSTVNRIEVLRGPSSAFYGGGAAGGVINVTTRDGSDDYHLNGDGELTIGSFGFWKGLAEAGGSTDTLNYRMSLSRTAGDGYRVHTAFDATNFYSKLRYKPSDKLKVTAVAAGTSYFNENAEGLNLTWLAQDPRLPNPDALTFNEYQRTRRATVGVSGQYVLDSDQDVLFSAYMRHTRWEESVPSSVQHRTYNTPGLIAQYSRHWKWDTFTNHVTVGTDLDWQGIGDVKYPNLGDAVEGPDRVADQHISQSGMGFYALDRLEIGRRFTAMADLRRDRIRNDLVDHLQADGVDLSGLAKFDKTTARLGVSFAVSPAASVYASWGQGFVPPTTEELANNPNGLGGLNTSLVPAISRGEEIGARGSWGSQLSYDVTFFHLATENDFGRYRVPSRPLETFYGNLGSSRRYGLETSLGWYPRPEVQVHGAYTYSDFKYTKVQSLFGDFTNVFIPNSPAHQLYLDAEYVFDEHMVFGLSADISSGWYVDQSNVPRVDGYQLVSPRISYRWERGMLRGEILLTIRNLFDQDYIAFTEPDPDGNSYQPGPTREFFVGLRIWLGK
jgi:iron complex outermembrane receptor protein